MADPASRVVLRAVPPPAPLVAATVLPPAAAKAGPAQPRAARGDAMGDPLAFLRGGGYARQHEQGRKPARVLRSWSRTNEWVRIAINRRKRQISQAVWHVVRVDDPTKKPDPRVVDAVLALMKKPNPKRETWRSLLDQVLEDLLVLDAGCIEKVRLLGGGRKAPGPLAALYAVDGATIRPDPDWDGSDPDAIRYQQVVNDRVVAEFTNDQLVYMMATPSTWSALGWSPVETAIRSIEADLYGDDFDFEMLRQTQPQGALYFKGMDDADLPRMREYWETEIEGRRRLAILGNPGAEPGADDMQFVDMKLGPEDVGREKYRRWTATKIAAAFELDLGVFNLIEDLHKDSGGHQQALTDEGHKALGKLVEEYLTAEVVADIDDRHALRIQDLNARDAADQGDIDKLYVTLGSLTPNEIRLEQGKDPVPWGDVPFIVGKGPWSGDSSAGQRPDDEGDPSLLPDDAAPTDGTEPTDPSEPDDGTKPDPGGKKKPSGAGKAANPFGTRPAANRRPTRT